MYPYLMQLSFEDKDFLFLSCCEQQAETQIKRRVGIGNHISERKLIDELIRMGMNEAIVSTSLILITMLSF